MKHLDLTLATPAENLAGDEALLDSCENGDGDEILRFWEPSRHFAVVGYANKVATEVNLAACEAHGVPVLRRCSGGGTVLQGPGCLNYALILKIDEAGPLRSISTANRFIMERNREAIEMLLSRPVKVQGHTDLAIGGLKFSGNSQRRRRRFLLFHGTFLLRFDLARIETVLRMPTKQPDYRQSRSHRDFLVNLNLPVESVKSALRHVWKASSGLKIFPAAATRELVANKYSTNAWNFKL